MSPVHFKALSVLLSGAILASVSGCGGAAAREAKHLERGRAYFAQENFDKARVEYQNALQIAPKDAEARFAMGTVDEKLANPREAAQFYQGTLDSNPDHVAARAALARLLVLMGAVDRAQELLAIGIEKHPDDARLLSMRAVVHTRKGDLTAAQADAERSVNLDKNCEDCLAVLAGVYSAQHEPVKSRELLEHALERLPNSVDLRLVLAQLYVQESRIGDAEAQLLKLVALRPKEKSHRVRLAQFYAQAKQNDAAEATLRTAVKDLPAERDLKLTLIDFIAAHRSREEAETALKAMIDAQPADNEMRMALAKFYQDGKQPEKAEAVYRTLIDKEKLGPVGLAARDRLAMQKLQTGDADGALLLVSEVLAKSPSDDDALMVRGTIALNRQDPRSAIGDLRAVLRDQPNSVGVLRSLALAHLANGEPAIAEETMRRAVERNPKNTELQMDLAQVLAQTGKSDQAKPIVADVLQQSPGNVAALELQFKLALQTKDYALASTAANAFASAQPKSWLGPYFQGTVAEAQSHNDEAARAYHAAVDLEPASTDALEAEMRALAKLNRADEALKRLDQLAAANAQSPLPLYMKGKVLIGLGRAADAQPVLKDAIARAPKWTEAYRMLAAAQIAASKDPAAGIPALKDAIPRVERPEPLQQDLAAIYERKGMTDDAIGQYEDILRHAPQSDVAANNLAMLLATYKKDPPSLDRAKQLAVRFADSQNPSYLDTYGWVLFKRGDAAASLPVLQRAVDKTPDGVVPRYHLGMAQWQTGNTADARSNLTRVVGAGTQFPGIAEAKAALDKLAKAPAGGSPAT